MTLGSELNRRDLLRLAVAYLATAGLLLMLAACASVPAEQPEKTFTSIAFSPDQTLLALANAYEIRVIDAHSWSDVRTLRELPENADGADLQLFRHGVGDTMLFIDNERIASTGMGGLVTIWDVRSGRRLETIEPLPEAEFASTIDYSDVAGRLAIGTSEGRILLTNLRDQQVNTLLPLVDTVGYVLDLQFGRDGKYLASASQVPAASAPEQAPDEGYFDTAEGFARAHGSLPPPSPNVFIWDLENRKKVGELDGATYVLRMALVPGGQSLLTVGTDVDIWTLLTREQLEHVKDPSMAAQNLAMGTIAMFSLAGMTMSGLPNMSAGQSLFNLAQFPLIPLTTTMRHACARAAAISPDGQTIVSTKRGPDHNVMAVIDRTRNKVTEKWSVDSSICDMQFSPDGKYLFAATSRGLFLFDTTSWKKTDLKDLMSKPPLISGGDAEVTTPLQQTSRTARSNRN